MDRRRFLGNSRVVAGGTVLAGRGFGAEMDGRGVDRSNEQEESAGIPITRDQVPGEIPHSEIEAARFPESFLWGTATAAFQVEGAGKRMERANRSGIDSRTRRGR